MLRLKAKAVIDEAIGRDEIESGRRCIEAAGRLDPQLGATGIEVAGGFAGFAGADSPFSQALNVGIRGPVTVSEIDRLTEFYESRGAVPKVFVSPAAHPSLESGLKAAGYTPGEREQSLLATDDLVSHAQRDERIAVAGDLSAWAMASAIGFLERDELELGDDRIALTLATAQGTIALEVRDGDRIVATGAMSVTGGVASLFAGSTHPAFRRRGWHTALIRDRVARAREAGARLVRATAGPGSLSEQNFLRCGFVGRYARVQWEKPAER